MRARSGVGYVIEAETADGFMIAIWVKELLDLPDLEAWLAAFARHTAATLELTSPMYAVTRSAGTGAQEVSGLDAELREMRYGQHAKVMRAVVDGGTLAPGLSRRRARADVAEAAVKSVPLKTSSAPGGGALSPTARATSVSRRHRAGRQAGGGRSGDKGTVRRWFR